MPSKAREAILNRVRTALKTPSPEPHWLHETVGSGPLFHLPDDSTGAVMERFRSEFASLLGEWHSFEDVASTRAWFDGWFAQEGVQLALAPDQPRLRALLEGAAVVRWIAAEETSSRGWEQAEVGITPALSLIAESGTIATAADVGGRLMSLFPPIHLVVATQDQLIADLETGFQNIRKRYPEQLASALSWISGPSRTADIEKILVLGAHGPRRLVLVLLPAGSLPPI